MERKMRKQGFGDREETSFGIGFPVGVIVFLMVVITSYLVALDVQIPPPDTSVYLPSHQ